MMEPPTLDDVRRTEKRLAPYIVRTPTTEIRTPELQRVLGPNARVFLKLEQLQVTGTFKARAALNNVMFLDRGSRLTAVSAGNHAIAVSYAGSVFECDSKVVMLASANPARIEAAKSFGAEVIIEENGPAAFERASQLEHDEQRVFIHPFEGPRVTEATGGVALELFEDAGKLDAVIVAIGGGGLASGVSVVTKQINKNCLMYGVEPEGADVMTRSFAAGAPQHMDKVRTIADSLAPPMTTPYAYEMCKRHIDKLVTVSDEALVAAMRLAFKEMKLALEPAGAAALAGVLGPLREDLANKKIGIIICGSNIDAGAFCELLTRK